MHICVIALWKLKFGFESLSKYNSFLFSALFTNMHCCFFAAGKNCEKKFELNWSEHCLFDFYSTFQNNDRLTKVLYIPNEAKTKHRITDPFKRMMIDKTRTLTVLSDICHLLPYSELKISQMLCHIDHSFWQLPETQIWGRNTVRTSTVRHLTSSLKQTQTNKKHLAYISHGPL